MCQQSSKPRPGKPQDAATAPRIHVCTTSQAYGALGPISSCLSSGARRAERGWKRAAWWWVIVGDCACPIAPRSRKTWTGRLAGEPLHTRLWQLTLSLWQQAACSPNTAAAAPFELQPTPPAISPFPSSCFPADMSRFVSPCAGSMTSPRSTGALSVLLLHLPDLLEVTAQPLSRLKVWKHLASRFVYIWVIVQYLNPLSIKSCTAKTTIRDQIFALMLFTEQ